MKTLEIGNVIYVNCKQWNLMQDVEAIIDSSHLSQEVKLFILECQNDNHKGKMKLILK